ncbi:hypothetical protein PoB_001538300 [Plakobranchus ocellatus]|uniref:Uncharacterized protein n=1 Tax=Plakobranchus ocellatus TaxID=259542 RepID=A0AAV3Z276_9GAST|nr:hypothetical protein PoB_001538300 [Plakobranchus ocellatus]
MAQLCAGEGVGKDRVLNLGKHWFHVRTQKRDGRGESRQTQEQIETKEAIRDHIKTFTFRARHYAREDSPG